MGHVAHLGRIEMHAEFWLRNVKDRDRLGVIGGLYRSESGRHTRRMDGRELDESG